MCGNKYFTASVKYFSSSNVGISEILFGMEASLCNWILYAQRFRTEVPVHRLHLCNTNFRFRSAPKVHFELTAIISYYKLVNKGISSRCGFLTGLWYLFRISKELFFGPITNKIAMSLLYLFKRVVKQADNI